MRRLSPQERRKAEEELGRLQPPWGDVLRGLLPASLVFIPLGLRLLLVVSGLTPMMAPPEGLAWAVLTLLGGACLWGAWMARFGAPGFQRIDGLRRALRSDRVDELTGVLRVLPEKAAGCPQFEIRGRRFAWLGEPAVLERPGEVKKAVYLAGLRADFAPMSEFVVDVRPLDPDETWSEADLRIFFEEHGLEVDLSEGRAALLSKAKSYLSES